MKLDYVELYGVMAKHLRREDVNIDPVASVRRIGDLTDADTVKVGNAIINTRIHLNIKDEYGVAWCVLKTLKCM